MTAHSTALRIYSLDPATGRLILASTYDDLAGSVVSLDVIVGGAGEDGTGGGGGDSNNGGGGAGGPRYDALLLGFAGEPRLSVVYPPTVLSAGDGGGGAGGTLPQSQKSPGAQMRLCMSHVSPWTRSSRRRHSAPDPRNHATLP